MILPFKGYRYSKKAGNLEQLIAPPYDVIGQQYRSELIARSPYNIVHLTLPESFDAAYHSVIAQTLNKWCKDGILQQDGKEYFYLMKQTFPCEGKILERTGFIGLFDLRASDRIIRHEVIFNKYKDDRIRLLEATKSNLEPIFLLYEDHQHFIEKFACSTAFEEKLSFEETTVELHTCKQEVLLPLLEKIQNSTLFIADGHHRFQASYQYFQTNPDTPPYIMVYLTNLVSRSLVVLPTHRALKNVNPSEKAHIIEEFFDIKKQENLNQTLSSIEHSQYCSVGVYFNHSFQTWTVKNPEKLQQVLPQHYSDTLKSLDVVMLHYLVIEKIFGANAKEKLYYARNPEEIVKFVDSNQESIGFFMQKPDLMKIKQVSIGGEILPPKTTFFYPKVPSGLVIARYA
ncbi:MAG TPA: DUF1015 domain-containing protein [bacterium]|nr:DUF1015 domain-containing protein [bacterium]HOL48992.1 DUF1015 domain-containing protein [bacterium]HPO52041.1 DUF1015 domain-containing protein [bacterium]HXK44530.1 DUF1015 domain-containing protein [bacterium]